MHTAVYRAAIGPAPSRNMKCQTHMYLSKCQALNCLALSVAGSHTQFVRRGACAAVKVTHTSAVL